MARLPSGLEVARPISEHIARAKVRDQKAKMFELLRWARSSLVCYWLDSFSLLLLRHAKRLDVLRLAKKKWIKLIKKAYAEKVVTCLIEHRRPAKNHHRLKHNW